MVRGLSWGEWEIPSVVPNGWWTSTRGCGCRIGRHQFCGWRENFLRHRFRYWCRFVARPMPNEWQNHHQSDLNKASIEGADETIWIRINANEYQITCLIKRVKQHPVHNGWCLYWDASMLPSGETCPIDASYTVCCHCFGIHLVYLCWTQKQ